MKRVHPSPPILRTTASAACAAVLALALGACGTTTASTGTPNARASSSSHDAGAVVATALTLESGWVKAGSDVTAVFGTVRNSSDHAVTLTGGTSDVADRVEIHTMEKQPDGTMKMTVKEGGLVVPAGGSATLEPGGDHLMLIDLTGPLANGDDVHLTMDSDGGTVQEWHVPVRSFAGAEETYEADRPHADDGMTTGTTH